VTNGTCIRGAAWLVLAGTLTSCAGKSAHRSRADDGGAAVGGAGVTNGAGAGAVSAGGAAGDGCREGAVLESQCEGVCGDGVRTNDEECDDGVENAPEGSSAYGACRFDCTRGPVCGDGVVQEPDEECDDGNFVNGDGCSSACQLVWQRLR